MSAATYPARVNARLDQPLSRWLWLVKWILVLPHYVVLVFLWLAFAVLSVVAGVAILVTGRYPRGIFEFNVGVLRWTWRVQYYAIAAFGTDRYPPFTLEDDPGYPAHFDVEYPEQLSRGLVLVKWWLLAIPHYLIVALFVGGTWAAYHFGGLVSVLTVIAGVIVLFTGSYPRSVYDFVLGMNRWVLRVAAYASLMTDEYPPFRLDMGGMESWPEPQDMPGLAGTDGGLIHERLLQANRGWADVLRERLASHDLRRDRRHRRRHPPVRLRDVDGGHDRALADPRSRDRRGVPRPGQRQGQDRSVTAFSSMPSTGKPWTSYATPCWKARTAARHAVAAGRAAAPVSRPEAARALRRRWRLNV